MKQEPKQKSRTAVEWLKPQIELMLMDGYKSYPNELEEVFEIAKEMENQQQERSYSEEEVEDLIYNVCGTVARLQGITLNGNHIDTAYKHFKKK